MDGTPESLLQVLWERGVIGDNKKFSNDEKAASVTGVVDLKT
jgi:hypothetical protein